MLESLLPGTGYDVHISKMKLIEEAHHVRKPHPMVPPHPIYEPQNYYPDVVR